VVLWRRAQQAAEEARVDEALAVSRELSASSAGSLGFDDELAVLLALEAVGVSSEAGVAVPVEAETALHRAIQASPLDKSFAVAGQAAVGAGGNLIIARQRRLAARLGSGGARHGASLRHPCGYRRLRVEPR